LGRLYCGDLLTIENKNKRKDFAEKINLTGILDEYGRVYDILGNVHELPSSWVGFVAPDEYKNMQSALNAIHVERTGTTLLNMQMMACN